MANRPICWICAFFGAPVRDDAHGWLARVRFAALQEERRHSVEVTGDVEQVNNQGRELNADQPDVTGASDKEIGTATNGQCAAQVEKEK